MKKIIIFFFILITPLFHFSQNQITLELNEYIRLVPEVGLNGNTIRGPSWVNNSFNDSVKTMFPKLIRYPGGNVSNYWNWSTGWFYDQSILDTVFSDTIYTMPNGWANLNPIDIKPVRFKEALNQIDADGIYVLNMMSSSLNNQLFELQNAVDSGLIINRVELGSEFNHDNPFSEIKFPTAGDYARESNIWIDSIKALSPSTKIGVVAGNRGPDFSRAWKWNDSICNIVNDADALIWHLYIYLHDDDTLFSNKQVMGFPFYRVPKYEQWRGFEDTISSIQDYNIWVTEYNLFDKTSDKRFANTWAHTLILAGMNDQLLQNELVDIMIQHNISGVLPNFDALDINNNFKKRASGFSALIWNQQMLDMNNVQKIKTPLNLIDSVNYQNNNGVINQVFFPKVFGWKFFNSDEERGILVNLSADTIHINASSILPENSNWIKWHTDSLFKKMDNLSHIQIDTLLNTTSVALLPYSINVANSFCYNDIDNDEICDHLEEEGCSENVEACNYNPNGTQPCLYPIDLYGVSYLDCNGFCILDQDEDGVCDELDNCPEIYNPSQIDFNQDGIGDDCDGLFLNHHQNQKSIIKVIDLLGKKTIRKNGFNIYIYDDGSVEKKYFIIK